jgi:methyltransferase (TIGR00027 family)
LLRIFEVDQLEVQDRQHAKLSAELEAKENVIYVPIDFAYQSLTDQLLAAGFERHKSTVFTLEGVSQYITKEAVRSTIEE